MTDALFLFHDRNLGQPSSRRIFLFPMKDYEHNNYAPEKFYYISGFLHWWWEDLFLNFAKKVCQSNGQKLHLWKNNSNHTLPPLSSDSNFHTSQKCVINLTNTLNGCWYAHLGWYFKWHISLGETHPCQRWPPADVPQEWYGVGTN